jgi:hypothetical protein
MKRKPEETKRQRVGSENIILTERIRIRLDWIMGTLDLERRIIGDNSSNATEEG